MYFREESVSCGCLLTSNNSTYQNPHGHPFYAYPTGAPLSRWGGKYKQKCEQALPEDDTIFFERTPVDEIEHSSLLAFAETRIASVIETMARAGVIVRVRTMVGCSLRRAKIFTQLPGQNNDCICSRQTYHSRLAPVQCHRLMSSRV